MHSHTVDTHSADSRDPAGSRDPELHVDFRLMVSLGLNLLITLSQVVGGILANSLGLLSDAAHNLSDVVALWIGRAAFAIVKSALNVLMERTPEGLELPEVERAILAAQGIEGVHDLHIGRSLRTTWPSRPTWRSKTPLSRRRTRCSYRSKKCWSTTLPSIMPPSNWSLTAGRAPVAPASCPRPSTPRATPREML